MITCIIITLAGIVTYFAGYNEQISGLKYILALTKNIFMPKNINCITIIINLKGNIRHKNIKIDCKQSNSRLSASCIYFVVLLTTNCLFKKQRKRKSFSKYKKKNEK